MNRYSYDGPVLEFGNCVEYRFKAQTMAVSEEKARSNIMHQWKISHHRHPASLIELPGKIKKVDFRFSTDKEGNMR